MPFTPSPLLRILSTWYVSIHGFCGVQSKNQPTNAIPQLNDVLSLIVGLWAVKVANQETNSKMYTYGVSSA